MDPKSEVVNIRKDFTETMSFEGGPQGRRYSAVRIMGGALLKREPDIQSDSKRRKAITGHV